MAGIIDQKSEISGLAREIDSPAAVIFTSIHVMKQRLQRIDDAGSADSAVNGLRQSLDLAATASERLVKVNRSLQQAIHQQGESVA